MQDYKTITSPPVYISPLDLGPKYADKLGAGFQEYRKIYGQNYCLGQLIFWHNQSDVEPDCTLSKTSRGSLLLPDISSFYAKTHKPSRQRVYGPKTVRSMLARMVSFLQAPLCTYISLLSCLQIGMVSMNTFLFGDYIILNPGWN